MGNAFCNKGGLGFQVKNSHPHIICTTCVAVLGLVCVRKPRCGSIKGGGCYNLHRVVNSTVVFFGVVPLLFTPGAYGQACPRSAVCIYRTLTKNITLSSLVSKVGLLL